MIDKSNRFVSIICPVCNTIRTQYQCLREIENGFKYNREKNCGKVFCAPYGSIWECEGGPWRCINHILIFCIILI